MPRVTVPSPTTRTTRPPVAAAADHAVSMAALPGIGVAISRASLRAPVAEGAPRLDPVVEGVPDHAENLIVLVALAGDQDGVPPRRRTDGEVDGFAAIELDDGLDARRAHPEDHLR